MSIRTTLTGTAAALVMTGSLLAATTALAYRGDPEVRGPDYSPERHEQMLDAFENGDYDAWKALMEESGRVSRVLEVITEENFDQFVEMRELRQAGDIEGAREIAEELGLPRGPGHGFGRGNGRGRFGGGRSPWVQE